MTGTVVCGIDDSASATGAARLANDLAERFDLPLLFVHVLQPGADDEAIATADRLLRHTIGAVRSDALVRSTIETGHPADRLVALAREQDASFVVVGCHGPRSSLLGSISADVSRRASAPVLVVSPAASEQTRVPPDSSAAGGIVRFDLGSTAAGRG